MIPILSRGKKVYKTDDSGNAVKTSLNADILKDIADVGGGKFYMIDPSMSALSAIDGELEKLEKKEVEQRSFSDYNSYFQLFLGLGLLLLIIEFLTGNKRSGKDK